MGSNYLKTLIKTLKERKNEKLFLAELNQIESNIEKLKDDQSFKLEMTRETDEPYLLVLNNINSEIEVLSNDKVLDAMKKRQSDDPFIGELPNLLNKINGLKALSFKFENLLAYTLSKSAAQTNKAIKPNRPLYVMVGAVIAFILALILSLISIAIDNRRTQL
jgi:hypothetical protein